MYHLLRILSLACLMSISIIQAQVPEIASYEAEIEGDRAVMIVTPEFYSIAIFTQDDHDFVGTEGGTWQDMGDGTVEVRREYNTLDTGTVGKPQRVGVDAMDGTLIVDGVSWKLVDDGSIGKLGGAWLITGRQREGEMNRWTPGERKTMKILSGTRFQWIAYHTGTKAFSGTGGGTYTTENGKYTETIDFFSRDKSRVGAELPFDFEMKDGEWHHSGLSSKGQPIYEIWSARPL